MSAQTNVVLEPAPTFIGQLALTGSAPMDRDEYCRTAIALYAQHVFESESRVDHPAMVIDYLTRAYDFFKKQKSHRSTLHIAYLIAVEHYEGKKYDIAIR